MTEKKKRKWIKWVIICAAVLITGVVLFSVYRSSVASAKLLSASSKSVAVQKGDISVTVQANGSLKPVSSTIVYAPLACEIGTVSVQNGDTVKKGDTLLTLANNTIDDEIATLQSNLLSQDSQILMADKAKSDKILSPVSGRVKEIYAVPGQEAASATQTNNGLILLSVDDKMEVTFKPTAAVAAGDPVTVTIGGSAIKTTINTYTGGEASILLTDDSFVPGTVVGVADQSGADIGSGTLAIHVPYYVSGSEGVVSEVKVSLNKMVAAGDTLIKLDAPVYSATYLQLLTTRENTIDKLSAKIAQKDQLIVHAPSDGVVEGLSVQEGVNVPEGTALFSVGSVSAYKLVVAVDELDVAGVQVGQTADIALDALAGAIYTGKVSRISGTGTYANGMTTYEVTILVDQSDKVLSGMSARADILVASHKDTILIPVSAIKTIDGGKYVMVMPTPGSKEAVSSPDGVQTQITIGLFNSSQAEVLSGLSEGQYVQDLSATVVSSGFSGFRSTGSGTNSTTGTGSAGAAA